MLSSVTGVFMVNWVCEQFTACLRLWLQCAIYSVNFSGEMGISAVLWWILALCDCCQIPSLERRSCGLVLGDWHQKMLTSDVLDQIGFLLFDSFNYTLVLFLNCMSWNYNTWLNLSVLEQSLSASSVKSSRPIVSLFIYQTHSLQLVNALILYHRTLSLITLNTALEISVDSSILIMPSSKMYTKRNTSLILCTDHYQRNTL